MARSSRKPIRSTELLGFNYGAYLDVEREFGRDSGPDVVEMFARRECWNVEGLNDRVGDDTAGDVDPGTSPLPYNKSQNGAFSRPRADMIEERDTSF